MKELREIALIKDIKFSELVRTAVNEYIEKETKKL
jgi:hypothetical protein